MIPDILNKDEQDTRETWEQSRRPEIQTLFETWVYGVTPKEPLDGMTVSVESTEFTDGGTTKKETVYIGLERGGKHCGFHCRVFSPAVHDANIPAVIMINPFSRNKKLDYPGKAMDHMPYDLLNSGGFIGVHADVDELCADDAADYQKGLWELYPQTGDSAWGAIGMWAFAASRVADYLIMHKQVASGSIAVCGCSRAGKAALWCGAQDPRFGLIISNVSGCTGAAVTRGKTGERIKDITGQFPHWMCKNYASFADREEELPVDQHMLLALCAPRPLYISSASEDVWADPQSEFKSAQLAGAVYALYGREGLAQETFPEDDASVGSGSIGYHNRVGVHGCRRYDWEQYLPFMKRNLD